jgi:hypothetical protein
MHHPQLGDAGFSAPGRSSEQNRRTTELVRARPKSTERTQLRQPERCRELALCDRHSALHPSIDKQSEGNVSQNLPCDRRHGAAEDAGDRILTLQIARLQRLAASAIRAKARALGITGRTGSDHVFKRAHDLDDVPADIGLGMNRALSGSSPPGWTFPDVTMTWIGGHLFSNRRRPAAQSPFHSVAGCAPHQHPNIGLPAFSLSVSGRRPST